MVSNHCDIGKVNGNIREALKPSYTSVTSSCWVDWEQQREERDELKVLKGVGGGCSRVESSTTRYRLHNQPRCLYPIIVRLYEYQICSYAISSNSFATLCKHCMNDRSKSYFPSSDQGDKEKNWKAVHRTRVELSICTSYGTSCFHVMTSLPFQACRHIFHTHQFVTCNFLRSRTQDVETCRLPNGLR